MTPAISYLEKHNISHRILRYEHDPNAESYGLEAAEKLGLDSEQVFKTLVVSLDGNNLGCVLIPVSHTMNLKAVAKAFSAKKAGMAEPKLVEKTTGYVLGGVSPIGQKKRIPCAIDVSAAELNEVYVSAGRRGLEIAIKPQTLAQVCQANFSKLRSEGI
jgi:Cys-tRNA(Pro)/Cys-tRNA(Cys) deacylase